jgi:ribonuclease P protein subunit POP4
MRTTTNVIQHEFIGKEIEVVEASNQDLLGIKGIVVDETRNTFVIQTQSGEKKILKEQIVLKMEVQKEIILIQGKMLVGRAEDRLKK